MKRKLAILIASLTLGAIGGLLGGGGGVVQTTPQAGAIGGLLGGGGGVHGR